VVVVVGKILSGVNTVVVVDDVGLGTWAGGMGAPGIGSPA
jgi:hypothetical protein